MAICENNMKEDFDVCDDATECKSESCINGRCVSVVTSVTKNLSMFSLVVIFILVIFLLASLCYIVKVKQSIDASDRY